MTMKKFIARSSLHLWLFVCFRSCWAAPDVQIDTKLGLIQGQQITFEGESLFVFYGVPYGESTGGPNRFLPSRLRSTLPTNPYAAVNYTAHCPIRYVARLAQTPFSEDCLHLNIWMPRKSAFTLSPDHTLQCEHTALPVLVYLYGGEGSIFMLDHELKNLMYDGQAYAAFGDLIFVTVNYRAGAFGQLMAAGSIPGNAGLYDQTLALQWVQAHIGAFCGDVKRVTLMGNSYGSMATGLHLLSNRSSDYFSQAIMQSGSPLFSPYLPDLPPEVYDKTLSFAGKFGCTHKHSMHDTLDLKCLQQVPMQRLMEELEWLQPFLTFGGDFFDERTVRQYHEDGTLRLSPDKRLMVGLVTNEVCISSVPLKSLLQKVDHEPQLSNEQIQKTIAKVTEAVCKFVFLLCPVSGVFLF
jgi:carboxylesterase type B